MCVVNIGANAGMNEEGEEKFKMAVVRQGGVVGICGFLHCARELAELMKSDSVGLSVRA